MIDFGQHTGLLLKDVGVNNLFGCFFSRETSGAGIFIRNGSCDLKFDGQPKSELCLQRLIDVKDGIPSKKRSVDATCSICVRQPPRSLGKFC